MKKVILNSVIHRLDAAGGIRYVEEPQSPFVIDNPDVLVVADSSIFGIYIPTVREMENFDSLLRRVYISRLVYARDLKTILLYDPDSKYKLSKNVYEAFYRVLANQEINEVVPVIDSDKHVPLKKMLSKKIRSYATDSYYKYINLEASSRRYKSKFEKFKLEKWKDAPVVRSWADDSKGKSVKDSFCYENSLLFSRSKTKSQSVKESLDSIMTYSLFSQYRLENGQLYVNDIKPRPNYLNTDLPVFGDNDIWTSSLAYVGVSPVSIDSLQTLNEIHKEGLKLFGIE